MFNQHSRSSKFLMTIILPVTCILTGTGFGLTRALNIVETPEACAASPSETPACNDHVERTFADIDCDGEVDADDFLLLLSDFGENGSKAADINFDGQVDIDDFIALVRQLGE